MKFFDKIKRSMAWLVGYEPSKAYAYAVPTQRSRPDFPLQHIPQRNRNKEGYYQKFRDTETLEESKLGKITKEKSVFNQPVQFVLPKTKEEKFEDLLYHQLALTNNTGKITEYLERFRNKIASNQANLSLEEARYLRDKLYKKADVIHEGYPGGKFGYMEKDFIRTADLIASHYHL